MSNPSLVHQHTPSLEVRDGRGLVVRQVAYHRADAQQPAQRRVKLSRIALNGQWQRQWDPRHSERLLQGESVAPGQELTAALSGTSLLGESRDAGWQLRLPGEAGLTQESWDSRGSHWQTGYDQRLRPLSIRESTAGQPGRIAERFSYSQHGGCNRRGRLVRHDDDAGSRQIEAYSLGGQEQRETRRFLQTLALPDWPDAALEPGDGACSTWHFSPLGEVLERIDALGNREHSRFNRTGELAQSSLTLADGTQQSLLGDTRYNAFAQIERQVAGNGVVTQAVYDPADGRLRRLSASRPARSPLQDLHYHYDRVGNVIRIEDNSQPVSHFANQRIDPVSTFSYDSLYQLREATGREAAGATSGPGLPDLAPDPGDTSRLLNYRQLYDYDASGNLLSLQHIGSQSYTRTMSVAEDSNHAVPAPGNPLGAFDANGNLLHLQPGQPLQWNARNQLHGTRQVAREEADDQEHYRYGGDGLRLRKVVTRLVARRMQSSETRYLPGLELHTRPGEAFSVITTQAGRCTVRCLVWSEGRPDGIANPQLRYSLDDLHGSSGLELDSEARIISHEGYYPFGGTAWWAARSALEAHYKTRRYSSQERDNSGLYAYGLRYYAPWLMRWINPDPAGDVDGLNRYRFVANNPLSHVDDSGLNTIELNHFSHHERVPAPERLRTAAGHNASASIELYGQPRVHGFAYDLTWTVRDLLPDMGNQLSSVYASNLHTYELSKLVRLYHEQDDLSATQTAEHAIAAGVSRCGEAVAATTALASSSQRWPGVPIYQVDIDDPSHVFTALGDHRVTDPLVVDAWVLYPIVHPLSASKLAAFQDQFEYYDYTPRMPGDPLHALSRESIEEKRNLYPLNPDDKVRASRSSMRSVEGALWHQVSAMAQSRGVYFLDASYNYGNGAFIPAHHAKRLDNAIRLADRFISRNPTFNVRSF